MSTEKMREEFEVAVLRDWPQAKLNRCAAVSSRAGQYADEIIQRAWWGWQASRAALAIALPKPYAVIGDYAACGGGKAVWDVEYAEKITDRMCEKTAVYDRAGLEAAGLKVKP